ncbi:MAG TPA: protein kinase [Longimicrobiales bacterium]|nr:protein kinase [Longimicrobiales bacterium]
MSDGIPPPAEEPGPELVGTVLAGRYRIVKMLGEGAMGAVYLGEHLRIGRLDAIKVLRPALSKDPESIARFTRGAQNASRVRHPNVCSIYDFGETEGGVAFLAMELIDGESLQDLLKRLGHLPIDECIHIVRQTALALQAAHEAGIVHRDLKPGNIMLTRGRDGRRVVKVVDFDIAKGSSEGQSSDLTQMGLVIGTPEYMSPEQLTADALDGRSDVYSLGMVLFRMLTGVLPFAARTTREVMLQRLTAEPGTLAGAAPEMTFPPGLQSVLDRALARAPERRFPDAEAFARALEDVSTSPAADAPVPVAPSPPVPPRSRPAAATPLPTPATTATPRDTGPMPAPDPVPGTREIPSQRPRRWLVPLLGGAVAVAGAAAWFALSGGEEARLDLLPGQAVLRAGERIQITPALTGADGVEGGVEWSSSDPSVASVGSDGLVTGLEEGRAAITARIGALAASAEITVSALDEGGRGGGEGDRGGEGGGEGRPGPVVLTLDRTRVAFSSSAGGPPPDPVSVTVGGAGSEGLRAEAAYPAGGGAGWLDVGVSQTGNAARVELTVDPDAVPVGTYAARVDVTGAGGGAATLRVTYQKAAVPDEELPLSLDRIDDVLDRQVNRLLDGVSGAALEAVADTARMVWSLEAAPATSRAQAAFVRAQAEVVLGNQAEALVWAERAVTLAPGNDGYRRLRDDLRGGTP